MTAAKHSSETLSPHDFLASIKDQADANKIKLMHDYIAHIGGAMKHHFESNADTHKNNGA